MDADTEEHSERPAWSRVVIIGGAIFAVLLLGATVGIFLTRSLDSGAAPAVPDNGSVEVGFAQDMSTHHLQAVTMASWERDHTSDPELKQLAFDIESSQTEQVGRMKGWLMLWDKPEQPIGAPMRWMTGPMTDHGHGMSGRPMTVGPDGLMPGMATDADLAKLRSLSGTALDVEFLQLMMRHHQGGTAMAQYAQDHSNLNAVKVLTKSILTSQGAEITLMTQMLTARGAAPLPAS